MRSLPSPSPLPPFGLSSKLTAVLQRDAIHTIQDALSFIAHPQPVQMRGLSPGTDASQQILIAALPPVLVLHVKRFYYDAAAGVVKLAKRVTFGPELEVGSGTSFSLSSSVRESTYGCV